MAEHAAVIPVGDVSAQTQAGARAELLSESEFQELYRVNARPLWAYLYRLTGNTADAEDLVQEAYCRLLATPLATRENAELRAYLFRVATNAATDLWRRGGRGSRRTEPPTSGGFITRSRGDRVLLHAGDETVPFESAIAPDHGDSAALKQDMSRTFRDLKPGNACCSGSRTSRGPSTVRLPRRSD